MPITALWPLSAKHADPSRSYGLIVGLGAIFAIFMIVISWSLKRYNNELQTSEMFTTAGRSLKSGLIASSVVSTWTWAATLLQSTSVAYRYGVSGPFWYASGATVQIILFATLAIELKRRAPNAHTFLEVVKARYGGITHGVFIAFCCMTNILVTSMLLYVISESFVIVLGCVVSHQESVLEFGAVARGTHVVTNSRDRLLMTPDTAMKGRY
jgi:Na+/proline symporter